MAKKHPCMDVEIVETPWGALPKMTPPKAASNPPVTPPAPRPGNHPAPPRDRSTGHVGASVAAPPNLVEWMQANYDACVDDGHIPAGELPPAGNRPKRPAKRPRETTGAKPGTRSKRPPAGTGTAPVRPLALPFDPTRNTGLILITSPRDGSVHAFEIRRQPADASFAPGERVVSHVQTNGWRKGFAFANAFGVETFRSLRHDAPGAVVLGKSGMTRHEYYADMINRPSVYEAKGYTYRYEIWS